MSFVLLFIIIIIIIIICEKYKVYIYTFSSCFIEIIKCIHLGCMCVLMERTYDLWPGLQWFVVVVYGF